MAASIRNFVERNENNDDEPSLYDGDIIVKTFRNIEMALGNDIIIGIGNLYITKTRVIWMNKVHAYDIDAKYIILHAITRDPSSYRIPCLYCQLDAQLEDEDDDEDDKDKMNDDTLTLEKVSELYLAPNDTNQLDEMFSAFSNIALNNPDDEIEDELNGELIYNNEEVYLGANQARILQNLDDLLEVPEQFRDD